MPKPTKTEIAWASRAIIEQIELVEDITRTDGRVEANKCAMWKDTVLRMQRAIDILRRSEKPLPEKLTQDRNRYQLCGWIQAERRHA